MDVVAMRELYKALRPMTPREDRMYVLDQVINDTGINLDVDLCNDSRYVWNAYKEVLNDRMNDLIGCNASQVETVKDWVEDQGVKLPTKAKDGKVSRTMDKNVIAALLEKESGPTKLSAVLLTRKEASSTVPSKFKAALDRRAKDGRVHDAILYCGAAATGRFSSKGLQLHNMRQLQVSEQDIEPLVMMTSLGDHEAIGQCWGVLNGISSNVRLAMIGDDTHPYLGTSDFSGIENKGTAWVSNDFDLMNLQTDPSICIYSKFAEDIFGHPVNKKDHPRERNVGKVGVLSLGYQSGWQKYKDTVKDWTGIIISAP
jgi:DNA polymerase